MKDLSRLFVIGFVMHYMFLADQTVVFAEEKRVENTGIDKILEHPVTVHPEIIKRWAWEWVKCIYAELSVARL